jgi:DNA modification methylase
MSKLQIEYIDVERLIPYVNNPRNNKNAVDKVAGSIKEFGFKNPVIVDKDMVIVAGHTRLLAARKLGLKDVPIIRVEDLTPEQVKAFRIADNKVAEFAEWDAEMLAIEFEELRLADFDLELTGFDLDDINALSKEDNEIIEDEFDEEPPEVLITKRGDIWLLGNHRLHCGDSTSEEDVKRLMDGSLAKMVFTDPPWNVNYGAVKEGNEQGYKPRTIMNDFMGTDDFKEFMNGAFRSMNIASENGAMTYVVMSAQEWGNMMLTLAMNNYHWSSTIIWNKDHLVLSRKDYHTKYEPIWYGWKEGDSRLCPLQDRKQSDVWDIDRPTRSDEHPTMKPVELLAKAINNSSKTNDNVLDLFGGSGTTLIAAEQCNRKCFMMELDPKYCDVIVNRYVAFMSSSEEAFLIRDGEKIPYEQIVKMNN